MIAAFDGELLRAMIALHHYLCRTLWKLIFGTIICQTVYMTMWAIHNTTVRSLGLGRVTDNLYRLCIPLEQLATASFLVRAQDMVVL